MNATRIVLAGHPIFYQPRDKSIIRTPSVCGIKRKEFFPILNHIGDTLSKNLTPYSCIEHRWELAVPFYSCCAWCLHSTLSPLWVHHREQSWKYVCVIKSFILLSNHSPKSGKTVLPFWSLPLWGANPGSLFFNHSHCSMKDFFTLFRLILEYFLQ